jgi:hypothetical protein
MQPDLQKLTEISSAPLSALWPIPIAPSDDGLLSPICIAQLTELLSLKNGFYAFESALHVLPSTNEKNVMGLQQWNSLLLWRDRYDGLADEIFFFAEDVFGGQFAINSQGVVAFDPETGKCEMLAEDVYGWARRVLSDFEFLTGHTLAHGWQTENRRLKNGHRLAPRVPFVTGGRYDLQNLYEIEASEGMRLRAKLATHIRNLPDGAKITWTLPH